jgi:D-3-phosphoglycerate dehydrogenase
MHKVLFLTRPHPYLCEQLQALGFHCQHEPSTPKHLIAQQIADYVGIVINSRFELDCTFLEKASSLKFIARTGSGVDFIDLECLDRLGIKLLTSPEGNRVAVAEHAMGMLLALMNKLLTADMDVRNGTWARERNRGHEIKGKTAALIGFGHNGKALSKRLHAFECKILAHDPHVDISDCPYAKAATMEEIYQRADIVSIHVPLTKTTEYLVDGRWLSHFAKPIYLINTARGKVVDTKALVDGLKEGKIIGAGLDVFEKEGVDFVEAFAVGIDKEMQYLVESQNVILSPHVAGWTEESHFGHAKVLTSKIKDLLAENQVFS